jgi:hypothetical protein
MKKIMLVALLFTVGSISSAKSTTPPVIKKVIIREIEQYNLDPRLVHTVYCHQLNSGVTTIMFPSEIQNISAARVEVKYNEKNPSPFLLDYSKGNSFFTVKSLASPGVKGAINVVYNGNVYVIHLETVKQGHSSVTFVMPKVPMTEEVGSGFSGSKSSNRVTPSLLTAMLDKAKGYHLFKKHYPNQLHGLTSYEPMSKNEYTQHDIILHQAIRFDDRDTIVFHIELKNKMKDTLHYNPRDLAVNVGDKIFYSSITDASGTIPAEGSTHAYFAITGNKFGGKNNLAAKNDWKVLLPIELLPHLEPKPLPEPPSIPEPKPTTIKRIETLPPAKLEVKKPKPVVPKVEAKPIKQKPKPVIEINCSESHSTPVYETKER